MKKKSFHIFLLTLFCLNISTAQDLGVAINVKEKSDVEDKDVAEALISKLDAKASSNSVIYRWEGTRMKLVESERLTEKPCDKAVFIQQSISKSDKYRPEIKTKVDTNGIVTSAVFEIFYNINYSFKALDVPSGEIETILPKFDIPQKKVLGRNSPISIDVKKYFGKSRLKSMKQSWGRYTKAIYEDYKEEIVKYQEGIKGRKKSSLGAVASKVKSMFSRDIYPITKNEKEKGLFKKVSVDMTDRTPLVKDAVLDVYTPTTIAGKKTVQYVTYVAVKTVEGDVATAGKTFIQSKKKFSKKLAAYDNLYGVTNKDVIHQIAGDERERINLALDANADFRESYERTILRMPIIRLIERGYKSELNFLRRKYKDDRFMDYDMGSVQDRMQGVQYILTIDKDNVNVTDVATGQMIAIDKKEGKRNWYTSGYSTTQALNMALMKVSNTPIEFLEATDQKKDKVKKIRLFHPIGFGARDKIDILVLTEEEVGGKKFERKQYIGHGHVSPDKHNPSIGVLKINKKGRKKFGQALANNQKFDFMYSIKRD